MKKYKIVDGKNNYIFDSLSAAINKVIVLRNQEYKKTGLKKRFKIELIHA